MAKQGKLARSLKSHLASFSMHPMRPPCLTCLAAEKLRLANGTQTSGRLMVLHQGVEGTVCFDGFTPSAATVA